jgi:hypothetical protein
LTHCEAKRNQVNRGSVANARIGQSSGTINQCGDLP